MSAQALVVVMLWAVALWRAPSLRYSPKQRSLEIAFGALAAAMTFELPSVAGGADSLTGITSVGYLLKHLLGVVSAAAVCDFVIAIVRDGFLRRFRRVAEVSCLAVMVIAFACAPSGHKVPDDVLVDRDPSVAAVLHVTVFTLYIGIAMTVTAVLFAHAARHASDRWIRAGHALLGLGGAVGVLYAAQRTVHLAHVALGTVTTADMESAARISMALKVVAITAIVAGSCVSPLSIAARATRDKRALRQLDPLWRGLTAAVPSVVVPLTAGRGRSSLLLNRRLVEIGDSTLALRAYVPATLQTRALDMAAQAGYPPHRRAAAAEAAWLRTAVLAAADGEPFEGDHPHPGGDGLTHAEELRWTRSVSAAFDRCPAVHAFATAEATRLAP